MKHIENLAIEGGGIKGIVYIGCLKALNDLGILPNIKRVVGTSVGSMVALFASCNFTNDEFEKYSDIMIKDIEKTKFNPIKEGYNLYEHFGCHSNDVIQNMVEDILNEKFGKSDITFQQLYDLTNVELTVIGTCISDYKPYYFNYKTFPNMVVSLAIKISTALPVFYEAVNYDDKLWVDGGVCDNFPIDYYDSMLLGGKTLGLSVTKDKEDTHEINNLEDYINAIITTGLLQIRRRNIENKDRRDIITFDMNDIPTTDFHLTEKQINEMKELGYNKTMDQCNNSSKTVLSSLGLFKFW